jgi:hypothetical protein
MDDEVVVRAAVVGVGVFLALVIFSALNNYYETARYQAKNIAEGSNIDYTYERAIEESFNKDELYGHEVKNLINHYNKSPLVRVDIHNANYLDANRQVLYRAFINANDTEADSISGSYKDASNLIFPFQKFKLVKFEDKEYTTYVLDGRYDKDKEDEYNVESIEPNQIRNMLQYYLENTYVIVELRNVQNIKTKMVPDYDEYGNYIGDKPVQYIDTNDFYNANNSFATSYPNNYDEARATINNNQEYIVNKIQTARYVKYIITGKNISL